MPPAAGPEPATGPSHVIRRLLALTTLLVLLAGSVSIPSGALAGGPPPDGQVPALIADGPVVLPNGKVLPV